MSYGSLCHELREKKATRMSKEIELKLSLSSAQAQRLQAHPLLASQKPEKFRLYNTYYDTPDFDLRKRGIALRLRRKGWAVWLMTVKGGDSGAGGLAERTEWEVPTQPGVFDFSIVSDEALREFLNAQMERLKPVFSTDFSRSAWRIARNNCQVELVLDRGHVDVKSPLGTMPRKIPLCEIEIELIEGSSTDVLFDLAIELASDLHLHPEILSKAERGYVLADSSLSLPVKACVSPLILEMSPVEAFRLIALSCILQLQRNEAGAIAGLDPEYVHQARVSIRRLRSAFKLFSPVLPKRFVDVYSPRWRNLAAQLGGARDWDVFLNETLAPLEEAFPGDPDLAVLRSRGETKKGKAQENAVNALTQREYSQLLLAFSAALLRVDGPTINSGQAKEETSLLSFAQLRLKKLARIAKCLTVDHACLNAERRHELRIDFKKLRYALDFFSPLFPAKRVVSYQSSLTSIQDLLGTLNDQVTASALIKELHPKGQPAPLTQGWIAGRNRLLLDALSSELRAFMVVKKPWR